MQIITIMAALCLIGLAAKSQTFAEWWHQKKTRLKYLREQVAALKSVEYVIRHGYHIEEGGLYAISNIDDKEWNLHEDYFDDLGIVSLVVKDCPEVHEFLDIQNTMRVLIDECLSEYRNSPWLSTEEYNDVRKLFRNILDEADSDARSLTRLVTDRQLTMSSGERLIGIKLIHDQIKEKYSYVKFSAIFIKSLIDNRQKEFDDKTLLIHLN